MQILLTSVVLLFQTPLPAGEPERPDADAARPGRMSSFRAMQQKAMKLAELAKGLGNWDEQANLSQIAMGKFAERNGWNSEPDLFAMELVRAVDAVPPWEFDKRGDVFFSLIGQRYDLNDDQRGQLQRLVAREAVRVFSQHSDEILSYASGLVQTRAAGEPFKAEQVAEWTKLAEPVMQDARKSVATIADEMMESLDDQQRARVKTDLAAADRRFETVAKQMSSWKEGHWQAEDWGMEEDPIQIGQSAAARKAAGATLSEPPNTEDELRRQLLAQRDIRARIDKIEAARQQAEQAGDTDESTRLSAELEQARADAEQRQAELLAAQARATEARQRAVAEASNAAASEQPPVPAAQGAAPSPPNDKRDAAARKVEASDAWGRYVEAYIRKYHLDPTQQQRAWLIYDESKKQADAIRARSAGNLEAEAAKAGDDKKSASEAVQAQQKELDRLFGQMKGRLEKIPTRAQRKNAEPGDLPDPTATGSPKNSARPAPAKPAPAGTDARP